jgi:hypothetical protein
MANSKFTKELFDKICEEIAHSSKGLVHVCKANGLNPKSFYEWIKNDEALSNIYTRARESQADYLVDEMIEIADDTRKDTKQIFTSDGIAIETEDKEWTGRVRMMLDTRKFIASKLRPKKYGDKLDLTTDGEKIQQTIIWGGKEIKI